MKKKVPGYNFSHKPPSGYRGCLDAKKLGRPFKSAKSAARWVLLSIVFTWMSILLTAL